MKKKKKRKKIREKKYSGYHFQITIILNNATRKGQGSGRALQLVETFRLMETFISEFLNFN